MGECQFLNDALIVGCVYFTAEKERSRVPQRPSAQTLLLSFSAVKPAN